MKKIVYVTMFILGIFAINNLFPEMAFANNELKKFYSYQELKNFIRQNVEASRSNNFYDLFGGSMMYATTTAQIATSSMPETAADFSTTNIQVEGVDEADIVKSDGKYIYVKSGDEIKIVYAHPAEEAKVLSEIKFDGNPVEMFVNKNKLVVFGEDYKYRALKDAKPYQYPAPSYSYQSFVNVYDISNRENPILTRTISLDGNYFDSRMIGDFVYIIVNQPLYYNTQENEINVPKVYSDGETLEEFPEIYYIGDPSNYYYRYTSVLSINIQDDNKQPVNKVYLMIDSNNIFVSQDNIYITYTSYNRDMIQPFAEEVTSKPTEKTVIHKISIANGKIEYKTKGEVPGHVLNQFSMDENEGYFRIATTTGHVARFQGEASSQNHVYVLDENLRIAGALENLAPGERIYSARFMGDRLYLVTFKKVDPLFVIDLSDANNPKVLGELKIPGYSDYLHIYDENHVIGLGKETVEAEEGDFAWYQGVKLSLFDVSDVSNPIQVAKYEIGDRGTDSYALQDHKAFLFSKSRNLLVIPILLAERDENRYGGYVSPQTHGKFVWQGAYVFDLTLEDGFKLKGGITHSENGKLDRFYFSSPYSVKRSLYIGNVLYTISDKVIKMNDLVDLSEVNNIPL